MPDIVSYDGGAARVVASCPALPGRACLFPFGPLSALRYDHVVYTPRTANHFSVCLPSLTPVDPGEAAGTVKLFRARASRSARISSSSDTHLHIAHIAHALQYVFPSPPR
jgi:hypothetical protein